jgi:uncharacterized membrane protein YjjP (DUF1212 family)
VSSQPAPPTARDSQSQPRSSRPSRRPSSPPLSPEELADYLVEIGGLLVAYGCPSYRTEDVIRRVGEIEGHPSHAFAIPTGLFVTVAASGREPIVRMSRVQEWGTDLDRLVLIDRVFNDVADDIISIREARTKLAGIQARRPLYPPSAALLATAILSGSAAIFFRGGPVEMGMSACIGGAVGLIAWLAPRRTGARFLVEFLGALVAALLVWAFTTVRPDVSREVLVPSSVISLFPGMTLTTGLAELARKNLVAGAARLMEAFVAFLLILFGIAAAISAEGFLGDKLGPAAARAALGWPAQIAAMLAASLAFAVLFVVPKRFAWAAILSASIGWIATSLGTRHLPPHVASFGASLAVCLYANGAARITQRPAQLFQLPGMMLLVPGSVGFLSLEDFLRGDFASGQAKGFTMLLIAGGIVTGVLLANVVLPAKKIL